MFRSVKSIVIPPASTGRDKTKRKIVILILQINNGSFSKDRNFTFK
jgi:hypothetical protein